MPRWQVVFDRQPFDFYNACRPAERTRLRKAFAELEANPLATGVSERRDTTGRTVQVGAFGVFLIHYWDDYLVKELRIVRIEKFR